MNHVVSYETAVRLKDAGFPQPNRGLFFSGWYAPCATELLPNDWIIYRYHDFFECRPLDEDPYPVRNGLIQVPSFTSKNPADAAAEAWLYVNKNNQL